MHFSDFLYNKKNVKRKFKVNLVKKTKSVILYNKLIVKYKKEGFGVAAQMIKREREKQDFVIQRNLQMHSLVDFQQAAASMIPIYRFWGYLVKQSDLCLERSMALTYALTAIGVPVNLVIGKSKYYINDNFMFHSWVELFECPINDHDGMHKQWDIIYRLPRPNRGVSKR